MRFRRAITIPAALALVLACATLGGAPARAGAQAPTACAATTDPATPAAPAPGAPCWTDVTPYPFGADGNPVDPASGACGPFVLPPGPSYQGDYSGSPSCYLQVTSMAFRAWNRGLAAAGVVPANPNASNAFGVWLYNGTRWFPDPTFPGSAVCKGTKVLWAGKLDYWLVGGPSTWPSLCRFDGVSFTWQPLSIPATTLARLPLDSATGNAAGGAIKAGACLAWDDCWFFGSFGVVLHWDGQALSDASLGFALAPWLEADFADAVARTDPSGTPFGLAVSGTGHVYQGQEQPVPAQPDGTPPPQLLGSAGGPFTALALAPPTLPQPGDPYRTNLVAVDVDAHGEGWVAGVPTARPPAGTQPAPLTRIGPGGAAEPCPGYDASTFAFTPHDGGTSGSYLWRALSVLPADGGDALAAAQFQPAGAGTNLNDDGQPEPALVAAACGQPPALTRFRVPDPFNADQAHAQPIPADRQGAMAAVAVNAPNDAWAASTNGSVRSPDPLNPISYPQRPHLYRLTDGQPPSAPAGDDYEPRPTVFTLDPPVYVEAPPAYAPPPPTHTTVKKRGRRRTKKLKPAVYDVRTQLRRAPDGSFALVVAFKVRRPVTIGVQALRHRAVVAASGLERFRGRRGRLVLKLDVHRWPTGIRFVTPPARRRSG